MFKVSFPASLRKFEPQLPVLRTMRAADRLSGSRVVLVADDEPLVRRTALNALRRYGYTAIEAENGEQVLRLVREMRREISLVLLDLTMPVMGGEETFPLLHQMCPDLPVLISSGFDEAEAESRFAGQGIAGFIKKPYTGRDLAAAVARGMDGQAVNAKAS
jgi:CheY-like chemotaxis protein